MDVLQQICSIKVEALRRINANVVIFADRLDEWMWVWTHDNRNPRFLDFESGKLCSWDHE